MNPIYEIKKEKGETKQTKTWDILYFWQEPKENFIFLPFVLFKKLYNFQDICFANNMKLKGFGN